MSFENILEHIGGCGRYQILVLILMNGLKVFTGYETLMPVIIAYKQDYQCSRNETLAVPGNGSIIWDKCHVYRNETPQLRVPCSQWDFDRSVMRTTVRSQFHLICDREYLVSLSTTFFFLGFVIGCTLYGIISDRFGRLPGILLSTAHLFVFSLGVAFSPTFWTYSVLRFFAGIGNGGLMSTLFTMAVEVTDPDHRAFFSIMVQNGFSIGGVLLSMSSFLLRDHFWVQIALSLPMLLTACLPLVIHESPRWLFATGRLKKADEAIRSIARMNRKQLAEDFELHSFTVASVAVKSVDDTSVDKLESNSNLKRDFISLFRTLPLAVTTLIIWYDWLVVSMGYFASYFTLGNLGGDIFLSLCINCFVEAPARILVVFTAKWWGRITSTSASYIVGGLTCILNAAMINYDFLGTPVRAVSALGKFFFTAAFDMIWFYSGEIFPTVIRNVGVGVGSTWARVGGTIAPQATLLFTLWKPAPLIIMGVLPIIGGLATIILPETKNKALPETLADGEAFVRTGWKLSRISEATAKEKKEERNGTLDGGAESDPMTKGDQEAVSVEPEKDRLQPLDVEAFGYELNLS